ncbi:peroxisomal membrane protein 4 [Ramicandelaber brevisporus]|nr:peroxisomal membrane protein 4 [Ramicandelaber brevisporus]
MDGVSGFLLDPRNHAILSIIKGFRNGLVYGAKVRFPHALVMTLLFRTGSVSQKLRIILDATKAHAKNLAFFVTIYKTLMYLLRNINGGIEHSTHSFLAGLVGGYCVFGENTNLNQQIVLYVFSRVVIGLAKMPVKHGLIKEPEHSYPIFAALVWGAVMWLFRYERPVLQPSLQASMQYLYIDSNRWDSLRNWIWHNI